MRVDFLVEDVWIEFFGLMNRPDYQAKTELKKRLAMKHGLKLVELYADDLTDEGLMRKIGSLINVC
jgi:hypothetical protein